jgi:hypothetical protein
VREGDGMTHPDDNVWLIAEPLSCCCIDAEHQLVWVVSASGEAWPIIRDTTITERTEVALGAEQTTRLAPHEGAGPLGSWWRERIAQPRCGRPRRDGQPCRTPVARVGDVCGNHRATA